MSFRLFAGWRPIECREYMLARILQSKWAGYVAAVLGIAVVTATGALLRSHINEMTVALAMLLVVLFVAIVWERWPGVVASVLGVVCLNYFFVLPFYSFPIADRRNWIALAAFFITASAVGHLSVQIRKLNAELEQRVVRRTAELQTVTKELEIAREREIELGFRIRQTLLLDQPPEIPAFRVAALTVPSQRIDGDFYVFLRHSDECLDVIVGDVMGKGVPAALLGAATKSYFLKALNDLMGSSKDGSLPEPKDIVMLAHAELVRRLIDLDSFVTLVYARLDEKRRSLDLVDCGHTGIIHWHGKTALCEMLHGDNLPLGVREGEIYDQISVPFEPGDLLVFFSDGITEARNSSKECFGAGRLEECVATNGQLQPTALVEAIRKAVFTFPNRTG